MNGRGVSTWYTRSSVFIDKITLTSIPRTEDTQGKIASTGFRSVTGTHTVTPRVVYRLLFRHVISTPTLKAELNSSVIVS